MGVRHKFLFHLLITAADLRLILAMATALGSGVVDSPLMVMKLLLAEVEKFLVWSSGISGDMG